MSILVKKTEMKSDKEGNYTVVYNLMPFKCPECGSDMTDRAWEHAKGYYDRNTAYSCDECSCQILTEMYRNTGADKNLVTFVLRYFEKAKAEGLVQTND
jgi:predicted RNA-binding Zn-ribbon protein involved in translation (DUF1610 family)